MTGPTDRKMTINALNSGARVWLADMEDASTPHWHNVIGGQVNLRDAIRRDHHVHQREGQGVRAPHRPAARHHRGPPAGMALRREARRRGRHPGRRSARGLRPLLLPQRPGAARPRQRPVLLPAQDREPPRGPALGRRLLVLGAAARHRARLDPGDGPHRDHSGGVRDGRDPLRAARPRVGPQRRPLGLPVQHHQVLPRQRSRVRPARPRPHRYADAVHARLRRAARQDLPPARRLRHRRHVGVHPEPQGPGGQRARLRQGPRGQAARGQPGLRRLVGGPPRPRRGLRGGLRRGPR